MIQTSASVLIVYHSGRELLQLCLGCLQRQTLRPREILLIDNSPDAELRTLRDALGIPMRVHRPAANNGFAGGNNLGIFRANSELLALVNPDAFPAADWLENLVGAAQQRPDCASFGSLQLLDETPEVLDGCGDSYHPSGVFRRESHGRPRSGHGELRPREIFSPCAAAALYRRDALLAVGGFDEDFFCYAEDVDLGFRLRLAGWKSILVPDAVVRHRGSASSGGQRSDFASYHGHRNMVWVYVKNMPGFLFWLFLPFHLLANIASLIVLTLRGQGKVAWRAKRDAIKGLPTMWKKRRAIQAQRIASVWDIWRALSWR